MTLNVSPQTEARLAEEAQRQGLSVDALIDRLMSGPNFSAVQSIVTRETPTVFEQGLGLFSSPEDAALIDEVVASAYTERRRRSKNEPLAL